LVSRFHDDCPRVFGLIVSQFNSLSSFVWQTRTGVLKIGSAFRKACAAVILIDSLALVVVLLTSSSIGEVAKIAGGTALMTTAYIAAARRKSTIVGVLYSAFLGAVVTGTITLIIGGAI
jgi:hypothetical protein